MNLAEQAARRRTYAIISHPDAGKTTLTEKLLLYSGAIHLAGSVRGRKASRLAVSDWMKMEQERGISITSSVLQFEYMGSALNLLDTPGHADFSEDTYRTLAAVDSAVMLMDHTKGVESRTRKLFEVCRMRQLPIVSFMNKLDRPGLDPLELVDEVGETLNLKVAPLNWPIGMGQHFEGVVDMLTKEVLLFSGGSHGQKRVETEKTDLAGARERLWMELLTCRLSALLAMICSAVSSSASAGEAIKAAASSSVWRGFMRRSLRPLVGRRGIGSKARASVYRLPRVDPKSRGPGSGVRRRRSAVIQSRPPQRRARGGRAHRPQGPGPGPGRTRAAPSPARLRGSPP